jgi:hypothetical protein
MHAGQAQLQAAQLQVAAGVEPACIAVSPPERCGKQPTHVQGAEAPIPQCGCAGRPASLADGMVGVGKEFISRLQRGVEEPRILRGCRVPGLNAAAGVAAVSFKRAGVMRGQPLDTT